MAKCGACVTDSLSFRVPHCGSPSPACHAISSAFSYSARAQVGVLFGVFVTAGAVCGSCVLSAESVPSHQVLSWCYCFKVLRVAALAVPAEVVEVLVFGDGPDVVLVHEAVGEVVAFAVVPELSVAGGGYVACPLPASGVRVFGYELLGSDDGRGALA